MLFMSLVSVFIIPRGLRRSLWVCSSHQPPLVFVLPAAVACLCVVFFLYAPGASWVLQMTRGRIQCHFSHGLSSVSPLSYLTRVYKDTQNDAMAFSSSSLSLFFFYISPKLIGIFSCSFTRCLVLYLQPFLTFCFTPLLILPASGFAISSSLQSSEEPFVGWGFRLCCSIRDIKTNEIKWRQRRRGRGGVSLQQPPNMQHCSF